MGDNINLLSPLTIKKQRRRYITGNVEREPRDRSSSVPTYGRHKGVIFDENHIVGGYLPDLTLHGIRAGKSCELMSDLITGHRLYCESSEFFKILYGMIWDTYVDIDLKKKVVDAICVWVNYVPADFQNNDMLQELIDEMKKLSIGWLNNLAEKLEESLVRMRGRTMQVEANNLKDFFEIESNGLVEIDCSYVEGIADILTVLDVRLIQDLCFSDLFESDEKIANNVLFTPLWVATQILKQDSKKKRTKYLSKFIHLCIILKKRGNLNSLLSVYSGITLFSIQRLKKSWKALPEKSNQQFAELEELISPKSGFQALRTLQNNLSNSENSIPCIMLFLKRISRVTESIEDYLEPDVINTSKLFALSEISKDFGLFKAKHNAPVSSQYRIHPDFQEILTTEELETLSYTLE